MVGRKLNIEMVFIRQRLTERKFPAGRKDRSGKTKTKTVTYVECKLGTKREVFHQNHVIIQRDRKLHL